MCLLDTRKSHERSSFHPEERRHDPLAYARTGPVGEGANDDRLSHIYRVFRNLWDPLRQLIVRLKIMKKCHINICPICLRL